MTKIFTWSSSLWKQTCTRSSGKKNNLFKFEYLICRENILQDIHKQYVVYQIALALKYLHSGEVIHRDLKPSNILLNSECFVKVCDFGLVRSIAKNDRTCPVLTEHVATRWYRAPEILLGSNDYTKQVDMWSLGCIIGQMILGKPMFPGNSTLNQLQKIMSLTGRPSPEDIDSVKSDLARSMVESIPSVKVKSPKEWFPYASETLIDLVYKLLEFNPSKRLTAEKLLKHPYVKDFQGKGNESIAKGVFIIKKDQQKLTTKDYRSLIYQSLKQEKKQPIISVAATIRPSMVTKEYVSSNASTQQMGDKQLARSPAYRPTSPTVGFPGTEGLAYNSPAPQSKKSVMQMSATIKKPMSPSMNASGSLGGGRVNPKIQQQKYIKPGSGMGPAYLSPKIRYQKVQYTKATSPTMKYVGSMGSSGLASPTSGQIKRL